MNFEFTEEEVALIKRSLRHSAESGQFFFTKDATEKIRSIYDKIRRQETVNKLRKSNEVAKTTTEGQ